MEDDGAIVDELVIAVVVTMDRPDELSLTLRSLAEQDNAVDKIVVIDTGNNTRTIEVVAGFPRAEHHHSKINLGGAGGFAFGMMLALSYGAQWVWVMDDDGRPEIDTCLRELLNAAKAYQLEAVMPLVIDPDDARCLSFPYRVKGSYNYHRKSIEKIGFIPNFAHLFNGALFHKSVFFKAGIPDVRLFIRGDEVEFLHRMIRAKISFGTFAGVGFVHPSGQNETTALIQNYFHAVIPETDIKQYCFFRNRGYIFRCYGLYRYFFYDILRYSIYFIFRNNFDIGGLKLFFQAMFDGIRCRFVYPLSLKKVLCRRKT